MRIIDYLNKHRMEPAEFAFKCDISVATVYRLLKGAAMHRSTARKIEERTENEVSYEEIVGRHEYRK